MEEHRQRLLLALESFQTALRGEVRHPGRPDVTRVLNATERLRLVLLTDHEIEAERRMVAAGMTAWEAHDATLQRFNAAWGEWAVNAEGPV